VLGVRRETDASLEDVLSASLGLVYRILFVLYAEQRRLLPLPTPEYRARSLTTMVRWATDSLDRGRPLSSSYQATPRYEALLELFRRIEHGASELGLPAHGAGPFSSADRVGGFLDRHRLSDRGSARVLAALARPGGALVDFTALTLRHLASVAEGLLDGKLWVVEASAGQVALTLAEGTTLLTTTPTIPDYVGVSITERAVADAITDRADAYAQAMDRVVALRREEVGQSRPRERSVVGPGPEPDGRLASAQRKALDALLGFTVMDPAMGTGTLLVSALDVAVDAVLALVYSYHETHPWVPWSWNPLSKALADQRLMASQDPAWRQYPLVGDAALLARLVVPRSIFGVDPRRTAVELARASLGMRAFAPALPFVPLQSHIRQGDSLTGLRLNQLLADLRHAGPVSAGLADRVLAALQASRGEGGSGLDLLPLQRLFDLWLSRHYGNAGVLDLVQRWGDDLLSMLSGGYDLTEMDQAILDRADAIREEQGFLHWDLVFPDVFHPTGSEPAVASGFDVIVGRAVIPRTSGEQSGQAQGQPWVASAERSALAARARLLLRDPGGRLALVTTSVDASP
jgi:hypothetical protein